MSVPRLQDVPPVQLVVHVSMGGQYSWVCSAPKLWPSSWATTTKSQVKLPGFPVQLPQSMFPFMLPLTP